MAKAEDDRILYWPALIAAGCPVACVVALASPLLPSLLFLLVAVFWASAVSFTVVSCAEWARGRAWRRVLSGLVLPLSSLIVGINLQASWQAANTAANDIVLLASYSSYRAELAKEPADQPRFKVWQWSGAGPCFYGVAYDETDKIASQPWEEYDQHGKETVTSDARAFDHFYFVDICYD
jgi:hypothetical protein